MADKLKEGKLERTAKNINKLFITEKTKLSKVPQLSDLKFQRSLPRSTRCSLRINGQMFKPSTIDTNKDDYGRIDEERRLKDAGIIHNAHMLLSHYKE